MLTIEVVFPIFILTHFIFLQGWDATDLHGGALLPRRKNGGLPVVSVELATPSPHSACAQRVETTWTDAPPFSITMHKNTMSDGQVNYICRQFSLFTIVINRIYTYSLCKFFCLLEKPVIYIYIINTIACDLMYISFFLPVEYTILLLSWH